jgi:AcrR family transcriptional regulator
MVSQRPGRASSRDRLLAAASAEFAARGFDGAKVDRIASRARVNKAMLYYHFTNKAALYRAILADLFGTLAAKVAEGRAEGGTPEAQIHRFIATIAREMAARPHFPPIWLREVAEGGRHLDASLAEAVVTIVGVLAAILQDGRSRGEFGDAHPLIIQIGIVAPLLLFAASAPARKRLARAAPAGIAGVSREAVIAHVESATLAVLRQRSGRSSASPPVVFPRRSSPRRSAP